MYSVSSRCRWTSLSPSPLLHAEMPLCARSAPGLSSFAWRNSLPPTHRASRLHGVAALWKSSQFSTPFLPSNPSPSSLQSLDLKLHRRSHVSPVEATAVSGSKESSVKGRRAENVEGDIFVDHTCIDCDTCRWMAPDIFSRVGGQSAVTHQPESKEDRLRALQAVLACPTGSIRTVEPPRDIKEAQASFPIPIDPSLPGIYHCGYHSRKSYGATSYLIVRPSGGNVLVDSPRFSEHLAARIEALGGVQYMFLTHKDDVADHERWHHRFRAVRVMHENDINSGTVDVEMKLRGRGPWNLGADIDIHHTPGHTAGCTSLLYMPLQVLFSGDHIAYSHRMGRLSIFRNVNWYSIPHQIKSVRALLPLNFLWILPGHGRRYHFKDLEHKTVALTELIALEEGVVNNKQGAK
eukprot:TRINITY_DN303_c0_g1_i1.p1 TRINITY_DN303_c0_g1~~TRINITY_DN303_c0_g1_i1.p1  ORF type:complete len:427 (-),score=29.85 TRINITY_DN303_c0_g1_i1:563-1783(-)